MTRTDCKYTLPLCELVVVTTTGTTIYQVNVKAGQIDIQQETSKMGAIYGPHIINGAAPHLSDLQRLQPRLALFLDPNADDVRAFRQRCPNTVVVGRIYVPDSEVESRIRADPEGAAQWAHDLSMQNSAVAAGLIDYVQVANEVLQFADGLPLLNRFELKRMQLAEAAGRRCAILAFSVGQPDLPVNDRLALWRLVYPALARAENGGHIVAIHQYGAPDLWGPAEKGGAAWLSNRLETQVLPILPYKKVKFAVVEFGIDGLLLDESVRSVAPPFGVGVRTPSKDLRGSAAGRNFSGPAGWQRYTTVAGFIQQLKDMGQWLAQFSDRIIGYALFTLGNNPPWGSYDIAGAMLRSLADEFGGAPTPPPPPVTPTLAERLAATFGPLFYDLRGSLPQHATLKYATRPLSAITQFILHHAVTPLDTQWPVVGWYHVGTKGWPGIGYHAGLRITPAGIEISLLNSPETISYHAGNANGYSVAFCVMGNFETDSVTDALWHAILKLQDVFEAHLGRAIPMIGHRDATGAQTACPGAHLYAKLISPPEVIPMLQPEVLDGQGGSHDLAWLQANYGALIAVHQVPAPCYRLKSIVIKETGDVNLDIWVRNKAGQPEMGTPVTYSFPATGFDDALVMSSTELPSIPAAYLSRWAETGVLNKNATGGDGHVAFQIGSQSWINSSTGGGPYAVWVLSNRLPSDCINRIGWRVLTNHFGPTSFLFEEVTADAVVPPVDSYATLAESVRGEAARNDVLRINPDAALCKAARVVGLWPTSNEYSWTFGGVNYTGQRFRNPANNQVTAFYCVTGNWDTVLRQDW